MERGLFICFPKNYIFFPSPTAHVSHLHAWIVAKIPPMMAMFLRAMTMFALMRLIGCGVKREDVEKVAIGVAQKCGCV